MTDGPWCRWDGTDLVLHLKLQPRASRDGFAGDDECAEGLPIARSKLLGAKNEDGSMPARAGPHYAQL